MAFPNQQNNPAGAIPVYMAPAPAGATGTQIINIIAAGNYQIAMASGTLVTLLVGVGAVGASLTLHNGPNITDPVLATISGENTTSLTLNLPFNGGLAAVSAGDANYTLIYS